MVVINATTGVYMDVNDKGQEEELWLMRAYDLDGEVVMEKYVTYKEWVMERELYDECTIRSLNTTNRNWSSADQGGKHADQDHVRLQRAGLRKHDTRLRSRGDHRECPDG